ncbi:hypothetical protein ACEQUB_03231 [Ralstonia syzygii]
MSAAAGTAALASVGTARVAWLLLGATGLILEGSVVGVKRA